MAGFDIKAAASEGYSPSEIADYLGTQSNFNVAEARKGGYSDDEIIAHLAPTYAPGKPLQVTIGGRPGTAAPEAIPQTPPTLMDTAEQYARVGTRAMAPYATAAGLGAMVGGPPGAAMGTLALGAGDIGTAVYNAATPLWKGQRIPLPSEGIQNAFGSVGIGARPQTKGQQVFSDIAQGAAGGLGTASAANALAKTATSPTAKSIMNFLGQNLRGATGAGAVGAAAPSVAKNYFNVTDPNALMALSMAGGVVGGRKFTPTPKAVPADVLKGRATDIYKQMESQGVNVAPSAMADLETAIQTKLAGMRFDPDTDKLVNEALKLVSLKSGKPMSYEMLDRFRQAIRDLPYTQGGAPRGSATEQAMVGKIDDTIDDFMHNLSPAQTTAGNPAAAAKLLDQARSARAQAYQTSTLEKAVTDAKNIADRLDSPKPFGAALRDTFFDISKDPRKMGKFNAETQKAIKLVANGTATQKTLAFLGHLAPSKGMLFELPFIAMISPQAAMGVGAARGLGAAAKYGAYAGVKKTAQNALVSASGAKPSGPGYSLVVPTAQQAILARDRATKPPYANAMRR